MKSITILVSVFAFSAWAEVNSINPTISTLKNNRPYFPDEDVQNFSRIVYYADENQRNFISENLSNSVIEAKAVESDVVFYLHTRNFDAETGVSVSQAGSLASYFDPSKPIVFLVHGWNNDRHSSVNEVVRPALLEHLDVNVIVVDWGKIANRNYLTASYAVNDIGKYVGKFVENLATLYNVQPDQCNCIGHSLGAHVCGGFGAYLNGAINQIVGLDPASPLFTVSNTDARVDTTDAKFVHVIHTSGGYLGFKSAIGHADYYPNGGSAQPGCGIDLVRTCAHSRAYHFFADSIRFYNYIAWACKTFSEMVANKCDERPTSMMGGFFTDNTASGDFYLRTASTEPYGLGDKHMVVEAINNEIV